MRVSGVFFLGVDAVAKLSDAVGPHANRLTFHLEPHDQSQTAEQCGPAQLTRPR